MRWPGVIKPGQTSKELTAAIDLYPTLAEAAGIPIEIPQGGQKLDGVSVWKTWTGKSSEHPRDNLLYWHGWGLATAIRQGEWKLFFGSQKGEPSTKNGPALFHLTNDPGETKDLSAEHPEKVQTMLTLARTELEDIHQNSIQMGATDDAKWRAEKHVPKKKWGKWLTEAPSSGK